MEQNREPISRPTKIYDLSLTKEPRQYNGAKIVFSTNGTGTTGHQHAK